MKVSVVVPVWNPGPNLQRCVDSLLNQSLPAADYEVVFVDDGSTDGTGARLDELGRELGERAQVLHIPNSGWPGKPRNVGVDAARGEYVQFVDNDDVLAPNALGALYDLGAGSDADVVIGKLSSDFRGVNHTVFRQTVSHRTLADFPFVETLTPHKMFRREFLRQHGIRYPEGPTHLEDQLYVMRAYVKAESIALLADQACYFYLRRLGSGRNAGDIAMVPSEYYAALEQVLDVIDADVPAGELRDRLQRRFYRVELLGRLAGPAMAGYDDAYRRELAAQVRRVVSTRLGPGVHDGAGPATRAQGYLLGQDDLPGLVALAAEYERVGLRASAMGPRWKDGALVLDIGASLYWGEEPLRCEPVGGGWALPAAIAPTVPERERRLLDAVEESDVELAVVSRRDSSSFGSIAGLRVRVDAVGVVRIEGTVRVDPATARAGEPLPAGLWDLRLRFRFAGWSLGASLRPGVEGRQKRAPETPVVLADGTVVAPYWTRPNPALALDVGPWARTLAGQLAGTSALTARGDELQVGVRLASQPGAPMPRVRLLLEPQNGTPGALLVAAGPLDGRPGGATATVRLDRPIVDGSWRAWLSLAEPGAGEPVALPWLVHAKGGKLTVRDYSAEPG